MNYIEGDDKFLVQLGPFEKKFVKPSTLMLEDKEINKLKKEGKWDEILRFYRFDDVENRLIKYKYYG